MNAFAEHDSPISHQSAAPSAARWVAFALGTICIAICNSFCNLAIAAWIWPAALLYFTRSCQSLKGFVPVVAAVILAPEFTHISVYGKDTLLVSFVANAITLILWVIPLFVDCLIHLKSKNTWWTALPFPVMMVGAELINVYAIGAGTSLSIASSQANVLIITQACSVIGCFGLSFIIFMFGSLIERAFALGLSENGGRVSLVSAIAIIAILVGFGLWQMNNTNNTVNSGSVKIASVIPSREWVEQNSDDASVVGESEDANGILDDSVNRLTENVIEAADQGAEIVCWCEEYFNVSNSSDESVLLEVAKQLSAESGALLAVPYYVHSSDEDPGLAANKVALILPDGETVVYYKQALVAFTESDSTVAGTDPLPQVTFKGMKIAAAICNDDQFPSIIADMPANTNLLLVPTWDWKEMWNIHDQSAHLRAIENGVTFVRVNADGTSYACDHQGRILYRHTANESANGALFIENVLVTSTNTLFPLLQTPLAIVYALMCLGALGIGIGSTFQISAEAPNLFKHS